MPPYGSLNSPSLRKMNGNMDGNGHQRGGLTEGFSFGKSQRRLIKGDG